MPPRGRIVNRAYGRSVGAVELLAVRGYRFVTSSIANKKSNVGILVFCLQSGLRAAKVEITMQTCALLYSRC